MSFKQKSLRLVFKLWANHFQTFDSKFLGTISRTAITCPWERLHEEQFLWAKSFFSQSSSVSKQNFSVFLVKILQQSWQKCIFYVPRNNWWKTNFLKIIDLTQRLRIFSGFFWDLTRSFNRVAKTSHYMPNQRFEEKHFFWTKF